MHVVTAILVAQHLQDLLREAEEDRRRAIVRGAARSKSSSFLGRVAGRLRRLAGGRRGSSTARPAGQRPAAA